VTLAIAEGITVETVPTTIGGARGWWEPERRTITLVESYDTASRTRTMLHELAHTLDPDCGRANDDRAARELVAESAAYIVGSELGLDMSEASAFYVASWGADIETLRKVAARTLAVANRLALLVTPVDTAEVA
jgi:antirestriction protein ArdC